MVVGIVVAIAFLIARSDYIVWDRGSFGLPRTIKQSEIQTGQLPALVDAMALGSGKVRYAALVFGTSDQSTDDDAVNLQISFENGQPGFDWILLVPRNIRDQDRFMKFAKSKGYVPVAHTMNGVSYLRVECPDVAGFTESVVTEMYELSPNDSLGLIHEGFDWPES